MFCKAKTIRSSSPVDRTVRTICFVLMVMLSLTYVLMYLWLLLNSFRSLDSYLLNGFNLFDFKSYTLENFKELFSTQIAGSARHPVYITDTIVNTVVLVFGQVLLSISIPAFTAYIIAKYDFKLKKLITNLAVIVMVVPTLGSTATTYNFMTKLNLINTYRGVFLMSAGGFGFGFLLFFNFFAAIPWEYAESAFLDGASDLQVFLRIMYPQAVPIITAIAITSFINRWNDYMTAYIYLPDNPTIALGVSQLYARMKNALTLPIAFAGMTLLATVSLIIFAVFNKFIMNNLSVGGVKG